MTLRPHGRRLSRAGGGLLFALAALVTASVTAPGAAWARACGGLAIDDGVTLTPFVLAEGVDIELAAGACAGDRADFTFALTGGQKVATATATVEDGRADLRFTFMRRVAAVSFGGQISANAHGAELFDVTRTTIGGGGQIGAKTNAQSRYPYDWTQRGRGPVREGESIVPGFRADGRNVVYDTPKLGRLIVSAAPGKVTGLFPFAHEANLAGDKAISRHRVEPGDEAEMRFYVHASLAHIQDRRFAAPDRNGMDGMAIAQFVPKFWAPPPGVIDRRGLQRDPMGKHCGAADKGPARGRVCFPTADELRAFASAVPKRKGKRGGVIVRIALPTRDAAAAVRAGGARPFYYMFFGALGYRDADTAVEPAWRLIDSAGKPHMVPHSHRSRGNWFLLDLTQKPARDFFVGRALEALKAGYEGIFLDGGFLWNMPNGLVGGDNPKARISQNHARHLLMRELRQAIRAHDPSARLGVLANRYTEYMHYADYVVREGTALHWKDARALPHERVVEYDPRNLAAQAWQARYGRLVQSPVFYACKGPNAVLARSCRKAIEAPHAGYYYDSGDWHIYDSEIAASLLQEIYGPGDLYVTRVADDRKVIGHGVSRLALAEGPGRIWFSRQVPLLNVKTWTPIPETRHVYNFAKGVSYIPADRAGPGDWRWAREGFLYRDGRTYAAGDFYLLRPPTLNPAGDIVADLAPTFRIDVAEDTAPDLRAPPPDRTMTLRLRLPGGARWRLTDLHGATTAPVAANVVNGRTVLRIERDGPIRLTLSGL